MNGNVLITLGSDPHTGPLLGALLKALERVADFELTPTASALLVLASAPFLEIRPASGGLSLRILAEAPIASPRIGGTAPAPEGRCWNQCTLIGTGGVDDELLAWVSAAYELAADLDELEL